MTLETATSDKSLLLGTFLLTLVLVVYAALDYHRPLLSRDRPEMSAETATTRSFQHFRLRTIISSTLGAVFALITAYLILSSNATPPDPRVGDILRRLSSVEDLASSLARNDYAQRLATLQQNQEAQFSQIKKLMRLTFLGRCIERIAEAESNFDPTIKGAKTQIMTPQFGPGMHFSPQAQWSAKIDQIEIVAKLCPHNAQDNLRAEPKPEQMDMKTPDEPTGADFDQLRQIRRLYYQSANATALLDDLKRTVIQEMTSIRDQAIQEGQR
jgi:hypothetical protein